MKVKDVKDPYKKLDELVEKNNGILKTGDALAEGISKPVLGKYLKLREFERMEHGIYLSPEAWMDEMYILHLRSAQAVFSHDSALYLHDMTLRVPLKHTVTLMTGYNPSRLTADGIKVYTVKKELYGLGIGEYPTMYGNMVRAYDPERTICDILRSRSGIEIQTFEDALKMYFSRRGKNLHRLIAYANAFRVDKMLFMYLRVLLP